MLQLLRQLVGGESPTLLIPKASDWSTSPGAPELNDQIAAKDLTPTRVRFDAPASQHKFAVIVMLLSRAHSLLSTRTKGTRR